MVALNRLEATVKARTSAAWGPFCRPSISPEGERLARLHLELGATDRDLASP